MPEVRGHRPDEPGLAAGQDPVDVPLPQEIEELTEDILPKEQEDAEGIRRRPAAPTDPEALDLLRRSARAFLRIGKSMEESPAPIIHNLVGAAVLETACLSLEDSGDLRPEESALRERRKVIATPAGLTALRAAMEFLARRSAE